MQKKRPVEILWHGIRIYASVYADGFVDIGGYGFENWSEIESFLLSEWTGWEEDIAAARRDADAAADLWYEILSDFEDEIEAACRKVAE